jgi:hypothetical protein
MIQKLFQTLKAKNLSIYYWLSIACWLLSLCLPAYRSITNNIVLGCKLFEGLNSWMILLPTTYILYLVFLLSFASNIVYWLAAYKYYRHIKFNHMHLPSIIIFNVLMVFLATYSNILGNVNSSLLNFPAAYFWLASFILLFIAFLKKENK